LIHLDGDRPLRSAWIRDSLGEALEYAGLSRRATQPCNRQAEPTDRGRNASAQPGWRLVWVAGTGVAATILTLVIGLPALRRQHAHAQSIIRANTDPIPVQPPVAVEAAVPAPPVLADERDIPPRELAQAEPIAVPQPQAPRHEGSPASKAAAPSRWNFDLEHGTPMPPDARDVKPVY
jgi:hypothetical protein